MLACFVVFLNGCASPRAAQQRFEFSRLAMGVEARIVLFATDEDVVVEAARAAFDEIDRLEDVFSDWRPESELSRLSDRAGSGPIPVSADLYAILARAREISAATDGAFDVTVGPLVALWRESRRTRARPEPRALESARALVSWRLVELDEHSRTVSLARCGMRLDLGGISKGYATQRAIEVLADAGVASALVQMGGDIACSAPPPDRDGWEVDVDGRVELVSDGSIATSGDAEQHVDIGGVRYSHVVDPRTGLGVTHRSTVVVRARDGPTADALATAVGVLGAPQTAQALKRFEARLVSFARVR